MKLLLLYKNSTYIFIIIISRHTISASSAVWDSFQHIADATTNTQGSTYDVGASLTRICLKHRCLDEKLKLFSDVINQSLISDYHETLEEWRKANNHLEKEHEKDFKKYKCEIKKLKADINKLSKKIQKDFDPGSDNSPKSYLECNEKMATSTDYLARTLNILRENENKYLKLALSQQKNRIQWFVEKALKPILDSECDLSDELLKIKESTLDLVNRCGKDQTVCRACPPNPVNTFCSDERELRNRTHQTDPNAKIKYLTYHPSSSSFINDYGKRSTVCVDMTIPNNSRHPPIDKINMNGHSREVGGHNSVSSYKSLISEKSSCENKPPPCVNMGGGDTSSYSLSLKSFNSSLKSMSLSQSSACNNTPNFNNLIHDNVSQSHRRNYAYRDTDTMEKNGDQNIVNHGAMNCRDSRENHDLPPTQNNHHMVQYQPKDVGFDQKTIFKEENMLSIGPDACNNTINGPFIECRLSSISSRDSGFTSHDQTHNTNQNVNPNNSNKDHRSGSLNNHDISIETNLDSGKVSFKPVLSPSKIANINNGEVLRCDNGCRENDLGDDDMTRGSTDMIYKNDDFPPPPPFDLTTPTSLLVSGLLNSHDNMNHLANKLGNNANGCAFHGHYQDLIAEGIDANIGRHYRFDADNFNPIGYMMVTNGHVVDTTNLVDGLSHPRAVYQDKGMFLKSPPSDAHINNRFSWCENGNVHNHESRLNSTIMNYHDNSNNRQRTVDPNSSPLPAANFDRDVSECKRSQNTKEMVGKQVTKVQRRNSTNLGLYKLASASTNQRRFTATNNEEQLSSAQHSMINPSNIPNFNRVPQNQILVDHLSNEIIDARYQNTDNFRYLMSNVSPVKNSYQPHRNIIYPRDKFDNHSGSLRLSYASQNPNLNSSQTKPHIQHYLTNGDNIDINKNIISCQDSSTHVVNGKIFGNRLQNSMTYRPTPLVNCNKFADIRDNRVNVRNYAHFSPPALTNGSRNRQQFSPSKNIDKNHRFFKFDKLVSHHDPKHLSP
ncbi:unnamed protein product [Gordionus sp. m RMFG-2023]